MSRVLILLSTYNGEKYLESLLESLKAQDFEDFDVLVRDDGSTDATVDILEKYQNKLRLNFFKGENIGYAKSFWELIKISGDYDYFAFCDQDDYWLCDKISSACYQLEKYEGKPTLYTSNVICCDDKLNQLDNQSMFEGGVRSFYESLQRSYLPGCTFVFNRAARDLLRKYTGFMESHDWAVYIIVSGLGMVIYDDTPHILYRLHGDNAIGIEKKSYVIFNKIQNFFRKSKRSRSRCACDMYYAYANMLEPKYRESLFNLAFYLEKGGKKRLIMDKNFKGYIFRIYALLGKL